MDIRNIKSVDDLIIYFTEELNWNIDLDDFDEIDDITYDFDASDIGLKEEAFAKISSFGSYSRSAMSRNGASSA